MKLGILPVVMALSSNQSNVFSESSVNWEATLIVSRKRLTFCRESFSMTLEYLSQDLIDYHYSQVFGVVGARNYERQLSHFPEGFDQRKKCRVCSLQMFNLEPLLPIKINI